MPVMGLNSCNTRLEEEMKLEETVTQFFNIINDRDLEKLEGLLDEKAEFYFPKTQPLLGKQKIVRFFKILYRRYPELVFEIKRKIIQGEAAAVHWSNKGVKKGGEQYDNEGITLLEAKSQKIVLISDFFKDTEKF
jgi:ketosteroid isomerase-like protein